MPVYVAVIVPIVTLIIGIVIGYLLTRQSKTDGDLEVMSSGGGLPVFQLALETKPEQISRQRRALFNVKIVS